MTVSLVDYHKYRNKVLELAEDPQIFADWVITHAPEVYDDYLMAMGRDDEDDFTPLGILVQNVTIEEWEKVLIWAEDQPCFEDFLDYVYDTYFFEERMFKAA
jgi:hypothetical protein